jgi:hypothetical protein
MFLYAPRFLDVPMFLYAPRILDVPKFLYAPRFLDAPMVLDAPMFLYIFSGAYIFVYFSAFLFSMRQ